MKPIQRKRRANIESFIVVASKQQNADSRVTDATRLWAYERIIDIDVVRSAYTNAESKSILGWHEPSMLRRHD